MNVRQRRGKVRRFIIFCVLACFGVAGCSEGASESGGNALGGKDAVARVGDEIITGQDIENILSQVPPQYRARFTTSQGRREVVDNLVDMKMLAWEARKRGLDKQEAVQLKIGFFVEQVLAKELENQLKGSVSVSDKDIEQFYQEHLDRYVTPERIRARHILVGSPELAGDLLRQLENGGDFKELAKKHSSCPSASKGGDLGWFGQGKMDPAFEKAAFALNKGELGGVVKSASGYHVIRLDDRREAKTRSLEQVKNSIERTLQKERADREIDDLKQSVRQRAKVTVNDEYFRKFDAPSLPGEAASPEPLEPEER
jgi:peptidyl-prolyl cis-trans isomerase C